MLEKSGFDNGSFLRTLVRNEFASYLDQKFHDNSLSIVFCHNLLKFAKFRVDFVLFRIGVDLTADLTSCATVFCRIGCSCVSKVSRYIVCFYCARLEFFRLRLRKKSSVLSEILFLSSFNSLAWCEYHGAASFINSI